MRLFFFTLLFIMNLNTLAETPTHSSDITLSPEQKESYGITTDNLEPANEVLSMSYPAEVAVPNSQLQVISALQGGLVESMLVAEGDYVKAGQLLARIQSPGLLELQRDLLQTLIQLNLAASNLNRDKKLLNEGIIPQRRYLETRSKWQALVTEKEQKEASLLFSGMTRSAITELEKTRRLSSAMMVTAPFDGVLLEQMAIPGQKLAAADPLFQLANLSPLWLEIHVPVKVASGIVVGDIISVPEMKIEGEIITVGRKVHTADQGTLVRAIVRDNIEQLRAGQFVQAHLVLKNSEQRYLVSRKSVIRVDQETMIFIETELGFTTIKVDVVGSRDGHLIITSEKPITAKVVNSGAVTLKAILTGAGGEG